MMAVHPDRGRSGDGSLFAPITAELESVWAMRRKYDLPDFHPDLDQARHYQNVEKAEPPILPSHPRKNSLLVGGSAIRAFPHAGETWPLHYVARRGYESPDCIYMKGSKMTPIHGPDPATRMRHPPCGYLLGGDSWY